jgi:hypothetical protein
VGLATDMSRGAAAGHPLADPSGRQEVRLQLDRRKGSVLRGVVAASDSGARIRESNDRRRKEKPGACDQVLGDINVPNDEVIGRVVEDAAKLAGNA